MGKRRTTSEFIEQAIKIHGDKYTYDNTIFIKTLEKVIITCPIHGDFQQVANSHLNGCGCNDCKKDMLRTVALKDKSYFVEKAVKVHGDRYNYSKVDYKNSKTNVTIVCKTHGDFQQTPSGHLDGNGCQECGKIVAKTKLSSTTEDFIKKATITHKGLYDYSKVNYTKSKDCVTITCKTHGDFEQIPSNHINGSGCQKCNFEEISNRQFKSTSQFVEDANKVHGNKYIYNKTNYNGVKNAVTITCSIHGDFEQIPNTHLSGSGCQACSNLESKAEIELYELLSPYTKVVKRDRKILEGKELDLYLPYYNLAIEFHGIYWHSTKFKKGDEHFEKYKSCKEKGIQLIQIFEDEWMDKKEIVKSRLLNLLKENTKIFARKCEVKDIPFKEAKNFLEQNHIQGYANTKINLGLYYNSELVGVMTFNTLRKALGSEKKEGTYELVRYCSSKGLNIVGGASKLLKYFEKTIKPTEVISYADLRWSNGALYEKIGFEYEHISKPNYFYIEKQKRVNRFKYRKSELIKLGYDKNKTEDQITRDMGLFKIYDVGSMKFIRRFN